jgi:hypothetical protein
MKEFLILRLRNAAIACDRKGDHNMAALLTEAIDELEREDANLRDVWSAAKALKA